MDNQIIGAVGARGTGKTLLIVGKAFDAYLAGRKVYTNLHSCSDQKEFHSSSRKKWAHYITPDDFMALKGSDFVVVLDEPYNWFDSRGSGSNKKQSKRTYAITQSRKNGFDLLYALVRLMDTDVRMRTNTDILYIAKRKFVFDRWNMETGKRRTVHIRTPERVFPYYNTREIVTDENT